MCSICFEDVIEELVQLDCTCDVKYCLECISKWFYNNEEDICPICKEIVDLRSHDDINREFQVKRVYNNNSYIYKDLNSDYIITLNKYTTFNISCLNDIIYVRTGQIETEIINDMILNFLAKIHDDVVKRPELINCVRAFDDNLRCFYYNNDTSVFYQNKSIIIKLLYIEFSLISKKYYPYFEVIGFD